jgi:uncharacterized protein YukJ
MDNREENSINEKAERATNNKIFRYPDINVLSPITYELLVLAPRTDTRDFSL